MIAWDFTYAGLGEFGYGIIQAVDVFRKMSIPITSSGGILSSGFIKCRFTNLATGTQVEAYPKWGPFVSSDPPVYEFIKKLNYVVIMFQLVDNLGSVQHTPSFDDGILDISSNRLFEGLIKLELIETATKDYFLYSQRNLIYQDLLYITNNQNKKIKYPAYRKNTYPQLSSHYPAFNNQLGH